MTYQFPSYYHDFHCINKDCPDTCCGGWNISIDPESLNRYHQILKNPDRPYHSKAFLRRFKKSIDFRHSCIHLSNGYCPLLTKDNLCGMYLHLGSDSLCKTCRTYPRHQEEFGSLREISLSLSCPEAARIILSQKTRPQMQTRHTSKKCPAGQQVDTNLLAWLIEVRKTLLHILWNPHCPLEISVSMALAFSHHLQKHHSKDQYYQNNRFCLETALENLNSLSLRYLMDEKNSHAQAKHFTQKLANKRDQVPDPLLFTPRSWLSSLVSVYSSLEPVVEIWPQLMKLCQTAVPAFLHTASHDTDERILEKQLLTYFIQIYFLGAVYDNRLYDKIQFAVASWLFIRLAAITLAQQNSSLTPDASLNAFWIQAAYLYSRQIENYDQNLNSLFDALHMDKTFNLIPLLSFITHVIR